MMIQAAPKEEEQKLDSKTMQGVGTYRVLDNPQYMGTYCYLPPKLRNGIISQQSFKQVRVIDEEGNHRHDRD